MCGFVGGIYSHDVADADVARVRRAVRSIEHRGPDSEGIEVLGSTRAVLAFRRLAIIDRAGGDQPMTTGRGQHLLFNGEIYNFTDLRENLVRTGVPLRTRSDTEVLLWSLATRGTACLPDLLGMFAFAFLDETDRSLTLVRDRLGIKQVYYAHGPNGFFFASEPKALLDLTGTRPELNADRVPDYFVFRAVPAPDTLYRNVRKLPAGSTLRFCLDTGAIQTTSYWSVPEDGAPVDQRAGLDEFESVFLDAVRSRLVSDVPVGAFLSGGLDSSLVVAAMRKLGHHDLSTFTATFPNDRDDEGSFARRVARRFGTKHYELPIDPDSFLGRLPQWIDLNDDLVADASCLPLLGVSQLAREHGCIVLLSGEGSDELFAGYGSYHKFVGLNALHRVLPAAWLRRTAHAALERTHMVSRQDRPRVREYLLNGGGFMGTTALLDPAGLSELLHPMSLHNIAIARSRGRSLADLCAFDFSTRIPDDLMVRTDRATMGASIEARVPFLDHRVVEFAFRAPPALRALPGFSKILPRLLARRWNVPMHTILHRKIGFQLPIARWFRNELTAMWDMILAERLIDVMNYEHLSRLVELHRRRDADFGELLWRVAALELWYRRWIENRTMSNELMGTGVHAARIRAAADAA